METNRVRTDKIDMPKTTKAKNKTLKVILDSNALFVPLQFKIDIFQELTTLLNRNFEPILISPVRHEIEKMAQTDSPKMRNMAAYALRLAEKCKLIEVDETEGSVDDAIVKAACELRSSVFTNDIQLRKRLRNINVPVIYLRQKSSLAVDGRF
jgi:rRNA-processing protein FCF1